MDKVFKAVNDLSDLEIITPESIPEHSGFYYFPLDKRLGVNRQSEILNVKTGKIIKPSPSKSEKLYILITSPNIKAKAYPIHRVIARTFIGRPSRHLNKEYSCLEVNHIDGNRFNNSIHNLEWVTGNENVIHARDSSLKGDNFVVLIKCILTGEITKCISVDQCSKNFNISRATLHKHLKSENTLKYHKDGCLFRYESNGEWPINNPDEIKDFHTGNEIGSNSRTFGIIFVTDTITREKFVSDTISNICNLLKINYKTLWYKLKKSDNFTIDKYSFVVKKRN